MRKLYFFIIVIILAGAAIFIFTSGENQPDEWPAQTLRSSMEPISALETQINDEGSVTVKITPKLSSEITFEVALDTHSEELNVDLTQAVILRDENGREYKPLRWEGDPIGGHHRSGMLIFDSIIPTPKIFRLIIQDIGDMAEQDFLWIIHS